MRLMNRKCVRLGTTRSLMFRGMAVPGGSVCRLRYALGITIWPTAGRAVTRLTGKATQASSWGGRSHCRVYSWVFDQQVVAIHHSPL